MSEKIKLFLLPFAGGSRYSYSPFERHLKNEFEIIPLEYPGRGMRMDENLLLDLDNIAHDLFKKIQNDLIHPYALFGHSMGAMVGFLLLRLIEENNLRMPITIFVSGKAGPAAPEPDKTHLLPGDQFWDRIMDYGGCSPEVLQDESLKELFEPILRADVRAIEEYKYSVKNEPYDIPVVVMIGKNERVTVEDAQLWRRVTKNSFSFYEFDGDHFFLFPQCERVTDIIKNVCLKKVHA